MADARMTRLAGTVGVRTPRSPMDVTSDSTDSQDDTTPSSKKRKPTYYVRKEEKATLEHELVELEEKIRALEATQHVSAHKALTESIALNAKLCADVEVNNLALAGAQSMLSAEMVSRFRNPVDHYIYLPEDAALRKASLHALKSLKIEAAFRLIRERMRYLDIRLSHRHCETTALKNGDYVITFFDVTPFDGYADARVVFEQFCSFVTNQEISISEELGIISIRETDEVTEPTEPETTTTQCRLLSTLVPGLEIESNLVMCSRLFESADGVAPTYGIGAVDYIDRDDLYPYQSKTRIRKDLSACAFITQTSPDPMDTMSSGDHLPGVSMVRFATIRVHAPHFPLSKQQLAMVRANAEEWCDVMPRVMKERLGLL